jgi:hypothetical protein
LAKCFKNRANAKTLGENKKRLKITTQGYVVLPVPQTREPL